jgi:hypothetical protein
MMSFGARQQFSIQSSYEMGAMLLTGPQQGNFNAGYAFTYVSGNPLVGAAVSFAGEVPEVGRLLSGKIGVCEAIQNAWGSATANAAGIVYAMHDLIFSIDRSSYSCRE